MATEGAAHGSRAAISALARRPGWTAAIVVGLLYVLALLLLEPTFDTNDDGALVGILSGGLYDSPRPDPIIMNVLLGRALSALYNVAADVPWYAIVFYLVQAVAVGVMVCVLLGLRRRIVGPIGVAAVLLGLVLPMVVRYQFTNTAILCGGAGMVLLTSLGFMHRSPLGHRLAAIGAGGLIGLAFLIREKGMLVALAVTVPLALVLIYHRPRWRDLGIAASMAIVVIAGGLVAHEVAYGGDSEWNEYLEFNEVRGQLHGTPRLDAQGSVPAGVAWSDNDLRMFASWFYTDDEVFTTESVESYLDARRDERRGESLSKSISSVIGENAWSWIVLVALGSLAIALRQLRHGWVVIPWLGGVLGIGVFLRISQRFPDRVALPLYAVTGAAILAFALVPDRVQVAAERRKTSARRVLATGFASIAFLAALGPAVSTLASTDDRRARNAATEEWIASVEERMAAVPNPILVDWAGLVAPERTNPLKAEQHPAWDLDLVELGWPSRSPNFYAHLDRLGLDRDLVSDIVNRPNVFVLAFNPYAEYFSAFVHEHMGQRVILWNVDGPGARSNIAVYRAVDTATEAADGSLRLEGAGELVASLPLAAHQVRGELSITEVDGGLFEAVFTADASGPAPAEILLLIDGEPSAMLQGQRGRYVASFASTSGLPDPESVEFYALHPDWWTPGSSGTRTKLPMTSATDGSLPAASRSLGGLLFSE